MVKHTGKLRESHWVAPLWQFESLLWAFLPGFLWPIILLCLVLSLYLVCLRVLPCVCVCVCVCVCARTRASLSQDEFQQRDLRVVESLTMRWQHPLSFDLQGAFLCMCSQGGLLDFKNEKYVVFYLLSWQGPESSINPAFMEFLLLWNFCPQRRKCSAWGLSIFYLNTYSSHLLYPFIWAILSCFFTCL